MQSSQDYQPAMPLSSLPYDPSSVAISHNAAVEALFPHSASDANHEINSIDWSAAFSSPGQQQPASFQPVQAHYQSVPPQFGASQQQQQQQQQQNHSAVHSGQDHQVHAHHHNHTHPMARARQTGPTVGYFNMNGNANPLQNHSSSAHAQQIRANPATAGQASCVSSASCPWVLSPVANGDDWTLQQCADIGCIPDVPDVEACVPSNPIHSPSQSSADTFPPPVPIDFTTTTTTTTTTTSTPSLRKLNSASPPLQSPFETAARALPLSALSRAPTPPELTTPLSGRPPVSRKRRSSPAPLETKPTDSAVEPAAAVPINQTKTKTARTTKVAHSVVEQRYRDNLNGKITQLHKTLEGCKGSGSSSSEDEGEPPALPRTRKADVLASAIDYIKRAEKSRDTLEKEVDFLKTRITMLEKLVKCEDCSVLTQMNAMRLQQSYVG